MSSGVLKKKTIVFAKIPQIISFFIANNLHILDRNDRVATLLGIFRAGGIGYELKSSFRIFDYQRMSTTIIIIIFIDRISLFAPY